MKVMDRIAAFLQKYLAPIAEKMGQNTVLRSIGAGAMGTMPVTLGVMVIAIISKFPYQPWLTFLNDSGLAAHCTQLLQVTSGLMAIYFSVTVAYNYAKLSGQNPINAAVISMASFLILMPQTVANKDGVVMSGFKISNFGADGLFVAMITAVVSAAIYVALMKKNIKLSLPDSLPPMVSDSLSPVIISTTILTLFFVLKVGISYTSYGDVFTFVAKTISAPIMNVGANPWAVIIVYTLANICWFFGIHPTAITSAFLPVMIMTGQENVAAYLAGEPMQYVATKLTIDNMLVGGAGCTLALAAAMLMAKSSRYKSLGRLSILPSVFNINEPLIFGTPIILNPVLFVPMAVIPLINGLSVMGLCKLGLAAAYNPTVSTAAATPKFFNGLFMGGIPLLLLYLIIMVIDFVIWYPFFKVADNAALKEELEGENA